MDLQSIWHTHKIFIRNVGVGALVYVGLTVWTLNRADEAALLAQRNDRKLQQLTEAEKALRSVEGIEKGRRNDLEERVQKELLDVLCWQLPAERGVDPAAKNPYLAYTEKRKQATLAIRDKARDRNVNLPGTFGFLAEANEALVEEHLIRAHATEELVTTMLELGATEIRRVGQPDSVFQALPFAVEGKKFLRLMPISVEAVGPPAMATEALARFQKKGRFVEVMTFKADRAPRSKGELTRVQLTVAPLSLAASDEVKASGGGVGPGPGPGTGPSTPTGPLRRFGRRR